MRLLALAIPRGVRENAENSTKSKARTLKAGIYHYFYIRDCNAANYISMAHLNPCTATKIAKAVDACTLRGCCPTTMAQLERLRTLFAVVTLEKMISSAARKLAELQIYLVRLDDKQT